MIYKNVGLWKLGIGVVNELGNVVYWIDNGIDDVSEYMDEFDCSVKVLSVWILFLNCFFFFPAEL